MICAGASQVQAALEKITSHISNPKKFKKASPLLRQLLTEDAITKAHSNLLFEVPASPTIHRHMFASICVLLFFTVLNLLT